MSCADRRNRVSSGCHSGDLSAFPSPDRIVLGVKSGFHFPREILVQTLNRSRIRVFAHCVCSKWHTFTSEAECASAVELFRGKQFSRLAHKLEGRCEQRRYSYGTSLETHRSFSDWVPDMAASPENLNIAGYVQKSIDICARCSYPVAAECETWLSRVTETSNPERRRWKSS